MMWVWRSYRPSLRLRLLPNGISPCGFLTEVESLTIVAETHLRIIRNLKMICKVLEHTSNHTRLLKLTLRAKTFNATRLIHVGKDLPCQNTHYEQVLNTAAEFGQVEIVMRVLEDQKFDNDAHNNGRCMCKRHCASFRLPTQG